MPQVDKTIARQRAMQLRAVGSIQIAALAQSRIGQIENVLVEKDGIGRTEQFMQIAVPGFAAGQIIPARVVGIADDGLVGEAVRTAA